MKKLILCIIITTLTFSCNNDTYDKKLIGLWIQIDSNSNSLRGILIEENGQGGFVYRSEITRPLDPTKNNKFWKTTNNNIISIRNMYWAESSEVYYQNIYSYALKDSLLIFYDVHDNDIENTYKNFQ